MKILVTGARGFIGSVVLKHLQAKGYDVQPLTSDIRNPLPPADLIVHCAGRKNDEPDSFDVNVNGARNLARSGAKIINLSTAAAYIPRKGLYGKTKTEADEILRDHVTLKMSLVYGNGGILKTLIVWTHLPVVPAYGNAVFRPIYVEDVAMVIEEALTWSPGIYDVAGKDEATLAELIQLVAKIFHHKQVWVLPLPRLLARLQLTESNILGAEQTVTFRNFYGRSLAQGLTDICNQMSQS